MPTISLLCRAALPLSLAVACLISGHAQTGIGSVKTEGIEVAGNVNVHDGRATIGTNASVTAGTQTADVTLTRGGSVKVCAGSSMHVSMSSIEVKKPPVMVALDRGSIEIRTNAQKTDAILTPDMRFELSDAAPLDLRIRVVPNGDTCVENAGKDAPMLHVTDTFGGGAYFIRPGQHVLFEHGSLREVVDHESSPCGCPKGDGLVLAGKGKKGDGKIPEAAQNNPFPEAVSQGLAAPAVPQAPTGEEHVQVASTLAYSGSTNTVVGPPGQVTTAADVVAASPTTTEAPTGTSTPAATPAPTTAAPTPAPAGTNAHIESTAPPPAGPNPFTAIGRFFKKLFGGH
jgi:hypothetical protein